MGQGAQAPRLAGRRRDAQLRRAESRILRGRRGRSRAVPAPADSAEASIGTGGGSGARSPEPAVESLFHRLHCRDRVPPERSRDSRAGQGRARRIRRRAARLLGLPVLATIRDLGPHLPLGFCTLFEPWETFDCSFRQYTAKCGLQSRAHYHRRAGPVRRAWLWVSVRLAWLGHRMLQRALRGVDAIVGVSRGIPRGLSRACRAVRPATRGLPAASVRTRTDGRRGRTGPPGTRDRRRPARALRGQALPRQGDARLSAGARPDPSRPSRACASPSRERERPRCPHATMYMRWESWSTRSCFRSIAPPTSSSPRRSGPSR